MKTSVFSIIFAVALSVAGCVSLNPSDTVDARTLKWNKHRDRQIFTYVINHTNAFILDATNNVIWRTNFVSDMGHTNITLFDWPCGYAIESEAKSPDGNWIAAVYVVNCGAMCSYSSQINLRPSKTAFDEEDPQPFFAMDNLPRLSVSWISDKSILVKYPMMHGSDVAKKEMERNGIKITYEPLVKP